ncbi:acyl-CoA dehydrogenase family protein [Rhizobium sp. C4]|uniref:acyl-CoA dehydrogenase family protein n=1 Tax=Rhizobium sp. C4 TaxID=1349800 RepID=UPI001E3F6B61|nr:acyl-CoA dehydrogenase family protein [Rhizobium sp. C4]MCD2172216.1 acyl-CoA/acyl-ACP dehydrogenase [Rhizobium sp. C4]
MELQLSDEQKLILESAERFASEKYTFADRRSRVTRGETFNRDTWRQLADLGWFGIGVPEEAGGFGASTIENTLIAEALAKAQALEPYTMCAVLPARILAACPEVECAQAALAALIAGEQVFALAYSETISRGDPAAITTRASKTADGWAISGRKTLVVGGDVADQVLVTALDAETSALHLFLVDGSAKGISREGDKLVDWTSGLDLVFDGVQVTEGERLASGDDALAIIRAALDDAAVVLCAEAVGAIEGAIEVTAPYIKERHQYGVSLSSFQVLQHRMADMAMELVLARSAVMCALHALSNAEPVERSARVAGCKAYVTRIGKWATSQGIQLHGGYGITEEYSVGQYYKRLLVIDALLGRQDFQLGRYTEWMTAQLPAA